MCAITGYLDKTGERDAPIGKNLLRMLLAVGCRGPDSTGVAIYGGAGGDGAILRVKLGESDAGGDLSGVAELVTATAREYTPILSAAQDGAYLRLVVAELRDEIINAIERVGPEIEIISAGKSLEIVKQVGSPEQLEAAFCLSRWTGTHGIGHTRLSTESKIDLSHSQPFWAHYLPDVATVHNGHITNYHILRRKYEQRGVRFYTENDSEIIGVYLRDRMANGFSFEEALAASMSDFDGSFCYLASNADTMAFVKDGFGFKPLMVAETEKWVALATEEIALRNAFGKDFTAREPGTKRLRLWRVPVVPTAPVREAVTL